MFSRFQANFGLWKVLLMITLFDGNAGKDFENWRMSSIVQE
jgi:hypothetical protein